MKDDLKRLLDFLWREHRGATICVCVGIFLSIMVLTFGVLRVVIVTFGAALGFWIGNEIDRGDGLFFEKIKSSRLRDIFRKR